MVGRVGSALALLIAGASLIPIASCSSGSGSPVGSGSFCSRAVAKIRSCGFQQTANAASGPGACEEPDDARNRCSAECFLNVGCADIVDIYCRGQFDSLLQCQFECEPPPFVCADGSTVEGGDKCDGFEDCPDASDEANCPVFTCGDGSQIPSDWQCDGGADCQDQSDEVACPDEQTEPDLEQALAADCAALGVPTSP